MNSNGNAKDAANGPAQMAVNGSTHGWDPDDRDVIIASLKQNGGLKRISTTLRQRLDEAGWSQDLREYCTALFRSGAATTYDDALAIILRRINSGHGDASGAEDGVPAPDLSIPEDAKIGGADAVRKELAQVVKPKNDVQITGASLDGSDANDSNVTGDASDIASGNGSTSTPNTTRAAEHLDDSNVHSQRHSSHHARGASSTSGRSTRRKGTARTRGESTSNIFQDPSSTPGLDGSYWASAPGIQ